MGKKFNDIKPGTICTLVHNDSLIFRITHINESGFPFAKHSLYCYSTWDEFQLDKKPVCMAYTTEYKEATKEQKEIFIEMEKKEVNISKFKKALHDGKVKFSYTKKDGSVRDAVGTLNIDIMGKENTPKGTGYEIMDSNIRYYDLNSEGWRSFIVDNLISWSII